MDITDAVSFIIKHMFNNKERGVIFIPFMKSKSIKDLWDDFKGDKEIQPNTIKLPKNEKRKEQLIYVEESHRAKKMDDGYCIIRNGLINKDKFELLA